MAYGYDCSTNCLSTYYINFKIASLTRNPFVMITVTINTITSTVNVNVAFLEYELT